MERHRDLCTLAFCFVLFAVVFHLASAAKGYPFYRDQHLGTALVYAKDGVDFFKPVIVGFNATNTPTPQEPPIWQALAGLAMKHLGPWWGWANVVSLLVFITGLPPLFLLTRSHMGNRVAWWVTISFLAQPLMIVFSGWAATDGMCVALFLWFVFCSDRMLRSGKWGWFFAATLTGTGMALMKLPYFMTAGIALGLLLLMQYRREPRKWAQLLGVAFLAGLTFALWTRYTDRCAAEALFPHVELRVSRSAFQRDFYFGSLEYRLNPKNWIKGGWAALNVLWGSFALAAAAVWSLLFLRNPLARCWLLGAVGTTVVFTHLVLVHRHYYALYTPAAALLTGAGLAALESRLALAGSIRKYAFVALAGAGLFVATVQGLIGMEVSLNYDPHLRQMASAIQEHVSPDDKILIWGGGWGGDALIHASRNGLSLKETDILKNETELNTLRALGFNKVVLLSESPLLWALKVTNPGNAALQRETWHSQKDNIPTDWPTLLETPDLLIKSF